MRLLLGLGQALSCQIGIPQPHQELLAPGHGERLEFLHARDSPPGKGVGAVLRGRSIERGDQHLHSISWLQVEQVPFVVAPEGRNVSRAPAALDLLAPYLLE